MANGQTPAPGKPPKDPAASARTSAIAAVFAAIFAGVSALGALPTLLSFFHIEISKPINYGVILHPESSELVHTASGENNFNIHQITTVKIHNKTEKPITVNFAGYFPSFSLKRGDDAFPTDGLIVAPYKKESFEIHVDQPLDYATNLALDNLLQKNGGDLAALKKSLRKNNIDFLTMRKGYSNIEASRCFDSESDLQNANYKKPLGDDRFFGLGFEITTESVDKNDTKYCYTGTLSSEPG